MSALGFNEFDVGLDKITVAGFVIDFGFDRASFFVPALLALGVFVAWPRLKNIFKRLSLTFLQ